MLRPLLFRMCVSGVFPVFPLAPASSLFHTLEVKIPAKVIVLLLLPFFLNDFVIIFLKLSVIPVESLAYFYQKMPWIGHPLVAWQPASVSVAAYRQPLLWFQDLVVFALIPSLFFVYFFKKQWTTWTGLGLLPKPSLWDLGYSLVLGLQLFLVSTFIRRVLLDFFPSWEIFQWFSYDFPQTFPWQAIVILYACVTAALVEETIFRGLLIPWLQERGLNVCASVFVSALLFAGIHWCQGPVLLAHTFVFGMITGICFATSRKLWPLILAHFLIDLVAFWPWPSS